MKKISQKNYFTLVVLVLVTIVLTLALCSAYKNRYMLTSSFYRNANKITNLEFDEYMQENSDLIIYISDKYDLSHESFEEKLMKKINEFNLKDKLIYIDKEKMNKEFLKKLKDDYNIIIDIKDIPVIVFVLDNTAIKTVHIKKNTKVNDIIDYGVFE